LRLALAGSFAIGLSACTGSQADVPAPAATGASPAAGAPSAPGEVVARVGGRAITRAQLDAHLAQRFKYEEQREALDELLATQLLEQEAARRGLTVAQLTQQEVDAKVPAPDENAARQFYEQNRARIAPRTFEQVRGQIDALLVQQAQATRREAFRAELTQRSPIEVLMQAPRVEVPIPASAPTFGPASAPVTMVAFSDYQCPYCKKAQETVDALLSRYTGKIRLVHRDFPLDFHPRAHMAARAAYCAGEQGRFWEYHRAMLLEPGDLSDTELRARARALELQEPAFVSCLASDRHDAKVTASLQDAQKLGVNATPTYFINGRQISGARPLSQFVQVVDEELARTR
jgi:protein-disulfide isomerase